MPRVLALDPSRSTGYALWNVSEDHTDIRLEGYGVLTVETASRSSSSTRDLSTVGDACNTLYDKVDKLLCPLPDVCYIEDFFVRPKAACGAGLNYYLRAAICMVLARRGVKHRFLAPSKWQKFFSGDRSCRPSKEMRQAHGRNASKVMVSEELTHRFKIELPARILIDGKLKKCPSDVSDAIGIGLYGMSTDFPDARLFAQDA